MEERAKQYSGVNITCKSSTSYAAGSTALFMLQISGWTEAQRGLRIRAGGRMSVEKRWIKSSGSKQIVDLFPGLVPESHECTLFATESISPLETAAPLLDGDNFFVQVDLPSDLLPSFKGLSIAIRYGLEISFEKSGGGGMETISFPIVIEGEGFLSKTEAYHSRRGAISFFSVSNLNEEALFSRPYQADPSLQFSLVKRTTSVFDLQSESDRDGRSSTEGLDSHSYNISDEAGLICTLHILRAGFGNFLLPGDDINIRVDFLNSVHPCEGIRAKIVQKELRKDNSRIQERVVSVMAKGTEHAALLNITLPIPVDVVPTFDCPIAKLRYYLDFSFFFGSSEKQESFNWTIPITIAPRSSVATLGEQDRYTSPLELIHYWPKTEEEGQSNGES